MYMNPGISPIYRIIGVMPGFLFSVIYKIIHLHSY